MFLTAIAKWPATRKGAIIAVLFALSLGISIVMLHSRPESTFFLLHTRAWELLTGRRPFEADAPTLRSATDRCWGPGAVSAEVQIRGCRRGGRQDARGGS